MFREADAHPVSFQITVGIFVFLSIFSMNKYTVSDERLLCKLDYFIKCLWWFPIAIREENGQWGGITWMDIHLAPSHRFPRGGALHMAQASRPCIHTTRARVSVKSLFWSWLGVWVCSWYSCIDSVDRALHFHVGDASSRVMSSLDSWNRL